MNQESELLQNAKLKEIFDSLLMAGYFRVRIPSISIFDKVLGGLTWCITCSNNDVDVEYNDEMTMGQKVKLSEKVAIALKIMKCPYIIQPHQIQGLDLPQLFPVFQWLITIVIETRDERQAVNQRISSYFSHKIFEEEPIIKIEENKTAQRRVTKNSKVMNFANNHPIRVYSTLIEFQDHSALKTYNRICAIIAGQNISKNKKDNEKKGQLFDDTITTEFDQIEETELQFTQINRRQSFIGQNLAQLVQQNKAQFDADLNQVEENKKLDQNQMMSQLIQEEKQNHEYELQRLTHKISLRDQKLIMEYEEFQSLKQEYDLQVKEQNEFDEHNQNLQKAIDILNQKINKTKSQLVSKDYEDLVQMLNDKDLMKKQRIEIKKKAKQQMLQIQQEKENAAAEIPIFDDDEMIEYQEEYDQKKALYDERYAEFAKMNQEIAVLQRKIESFPSAIEISQYHQRFIELFESINLEMENYKRSTMIFNNLQAQKKLVFDHVELMQQFKQGLVGCGNSKSSKEKYAKELEQAQQALLGNRNKSKELIESNMKNLQRNQDDLQKTQNLERDYLKLLKQFQIQYDRNEEYRYILQQFQQEQ